jgi:hypothetical protein
MVKKAPPTEGDLEAEIHGVLCHAFPWLPEGSIKHQTTFSFSFGTKRIKIDNKLRDKVSGRADILLLWNDKPFAILELKRPGSVLTAKDDAQGLSYARIVSPQAPLVVVTNGKECRLLETHTGKEWSPGKPSEEAFAELVKSASLIATGDLKSAISTLMGSNPVIWAQAVRQTTKQNIAELTGDWHQSWLPFVPNFLIPRRATQAVLQTLREGKRLILVEGPPLIGKSNVLREVVDRTDGSDDFITFFVEAGASGGIIQQLADCLSQALNWPLTREEARSWLLNLSNAEGPALVIAVDGVGVSREDIRKDIEDLSSHAFGAALRVIVALDDTVADLIVKSFTGRSASRIGRLASRLAVAALDDDEFSWALGTLWQHRAGIMQGGDCSPEFRVPWVLRAVMSKITSRPEYANEAIAASIPSLLGLDIIAHARERFDEDELKRMFRAAAQALIEDSQDRSRGIALVLESLAVFVVRRSTLLRFMDRADMDWLIERGFLRPLQHQSGTSVLVVRIPELLASEAAGVLAIELVACARPDSASAANWLSEVAGSIPLGDIVAAQAVIDAAKRDGSLPFNLITALVNSPPRQEQIQPGTKVAMHFPGAGIMNMTFKENGTIEVKARGGHHVLMPEPGEEQQVTYSDFHSWLILSYLAGCPFALVDEEDRLGRVDPAILLEVGACTVLLRRPGPETEMNGILLHNLPDHGSVVCHESGIVEPITLSILRFLSSEGERAKEWLEEAARRDSLPLLARIDIALRQLSETASTEKAEFANRALTEIVRPALSSLPALH